MTEATAVESTPQNEGAVEAPPQEAVESAEPTIKNPEVLRFITQKEHALRQQQQALEKERAKISELQRRAQEAESLREMIRSSPLKVLQENGIDVEQLEELRAKQQDPNAKLMQEIRQNLTPIQQENLQLKQRLEALENKDRERFEEAVMSELSGQVEGLFESKGEDYPYLTSLGERGRVLAIQRLQKARDEGADVSVEQAIGEVEKELEPILEAAAEKLLAMREAKKSKSPPIITPDLPGSVEPTPMKFDGMSREEKLKKLIEGF